MIKQISKNIGHDGRHYCCLRCGQSGYDRMAQARGHLAMCKGTQIRKGVPAHIPAPEYSPQLAGQLATASYSPAIEPFPASYSSQQQQQQLEPAPTSYSQPATVSYLEYQQLKDEVRQMQNHYTHLLERNNAPSSVDWFSKNKNVVILVAVVVVAYLLSNMNRQCPTLSSGSGSGGGTNAQGIGQKTLTKVMDRAVLKGVDALFK